MLRRTTQQDSKVAGFTAFHMTEPSEVKKSRRGMRISLYFMAVVVCFALLITGAVAYSIGRTFDVAPWLKNIAATRFSEALPDADVSFDRITVQVSNDWHPNIRLERVLVKPKDGGPALEFSEAETTLSYRRLLRRQVAPRDIRVSGVFLNARRNEAGDVGVAVGGPMGEAAAEATSLDTLVQQIDEWLSLSQFEHLTSVEIDAVTIQFDDLRANRAWTVDGGQMKLSRKGDDLQLSSNLALLGGRDFVSTLEFNYQSEIGSLAAQFDVNVDDVASEDISSQSPALAWLDLLRAPISGALRVAIDDQGNLGPLFASLEIQEGVFQPRDAVKAVPFQSARSYFTYLPETNTLQFDELSIVSAWGNARAEGKAHLVGLETGLPDSLVAQFQLTELSGNPADLFDAPVSLDRVSADFRLKFDPFEVNFGEVLIQDQGHSLILDGNLSATENDWNVALNGHMDALDARRVVAWWPERAATKTRTWIDENIHQGRLTDINFAIRSKPQKKPDVYVDFHFDDATVRYAKTLPVVEKGKGQAVLFNDRFSVIAHEGVVSPGKGGAMDISGTTFVIPNVGAKSTPAEVGLSTSGTVTATLTLLDHKPLNFLSKANLPTDIADGQARVQGDLKLKLVKKLKAEDVQFNATAELTDVRTSHFTPEKVVAAPLLYVSVDNDALEIFGPGRIGGVPFDAQFKTALTANNGGKSQVRGTIELSERFIDEFGIGLSRDMVSGVSKGSFGLELQKDQPPTFSVQSDLIGTRLGLAAIGWGKGARQKGNLRVDGRLTKPLQVTNLVLEAPGLSAKGDITLKPNGALDVVRLSDVRAGSWYRGGVNLIGRGAASPEVRLVGGALDMRKTPTATNGGGSGGSSANGTRIQANLDRLTISEGITLTKFNGDFSTVGGFNGKFQAAVNNGAQITGVVVPQGNRSAVRIQSNDAGGTLRSAGVVEQTRGGTLDLTLRPIGAPGNYDGQLIARNVRIKDAPAMAELLNAISVIGLLEQLGGDGIAFTEVDARFRLTPSQVVLSQGSAVGTSMGLSMDGVYDLVNSRFDMQGVISPIYLLNVVGRPIARKGEGLFGFNYRLSGSSDNPTVRVNPLSVLTPGILRDIFRRPQPKTSDDSSEAVQN